MAHVVEDSWVLCADLSQCRVTCRLAPDPGGSALCVFGSRETSGEGVNPGVSHIKWDHPVHLFCGVVLVGEQRVPWPCRPSQCSIKQKETDLGWVPVSTSSSLPCAGSLLEAVRDVMAWLWGVPKSSHV